MNSLLLRLLAVMMLLPASTLNAQQEQEAERLLQLFYDNEYSDWQVAKTYLDSAVALTDQVSDLRTLGRIELYQGWFFQDISEFDSCRAHFYKSLEYYQQAKSYNDMADVYGNLGNAYVDINDFTTALDYQMKSLDLNEKILLLAKDSLQLSEAEKGRAYAWTNISSIFLQYW